MLTGTGLTRRAFLSIPQHHDRRHISSHTAGLRPQAGPWSHILIRIFYSLFFYMLKNIYSFLSSSTDRQEAIHSILRLACHLRKALPVCSLFTSPIHSDDRSTNICHEIGLQKFLLDLPNCWSTLLCRSVALKRLAFARESALPVPPHLALLHTYLSFPTTENLELKSPIFVLTRPRKLAVVIRRISQLLVVYPSTTRPQPFWQAQTPKCRNRNCQID